MKLKDCIIAAILTLLVISELQQGSINRDQQQQINQLQQPQKIVTIEPVKVDAALVDKLEELVRDNLVQEQIILDYKNQIESLGWLKRAADKEGLNP